MSQIKLLKINSSGFNEEHGSADDITFATVTGTTEVAVSGGVTITNDIAFNAVSDTIAGIQNQNLVDKTATEDITGAWSIKTGNPFIVEDAPANPTDAANKAYVDSVATGLDWQDSVLDQDLTAPPGGETGGERYIVASGATGLWSGHDEKIIEYIGASWVPTTPNEGFASWVEDEDVVYVYNGTFPTGDWVKMSSVYNHNDLAGIQGGQSGQYYHLNLAQYTQNVIGPVGASAVDESIARWDGVTGKLVQDTGSNATLTDAGVMALAGKLSALGIDATTDLFYDNDVTAGIALGQTSDTALSGFTKTSIVGALNELKATNAAQNVELQMKNDTGAQLDKGKTVYINPAKTDDSVLLADANAIATAKVLGLAAANTAIGALGNIVRSGVITGLLAGATAGDIYWLSTTAGAIQTNPPVGSGDVVIRVGAAKNDTDFIVDIGNARIRA